MCGRVVPEDFWMFCGVIEMGGLRMYMHACPVRVAIHCLFLCLYNSIDLVDLKN